MNAMDNKIFLTSEKPVKVVFEGKPISQEEAIKIWLNILQNFKQ
jgi:hypothetical protein